MKRYIFAVVFASILSACERKQDSAPPSQPEPVAQAETPTKTATMPAELRDLQYPGATVEDGLSWRDEDDGGAAEPDHDDNVVSADLFTNDGYDKVLGFYKNRKIGGAQPELEESKSDDGRTAHLEAENGDGTTLILISEDTERDGTIIQLVRGKAR